MRDGIAWTGGRKQGMKGLILAVIATAAPTATACAESRS
jgi:hypothetical protein